MLINRYEIFRWPTYGFTATAPSSKLLCLCPLVLSSLPLFAIFPFPIITPHFLSLSTLFFPSHFHLCNFIPTLLLFLSFFFFFFTSQFSSQSHFSSLVFCFLFLLFTAISFSLVHHVPNKCPFSLCPSFIVIIVSPSLHPQSICLFFLLSSLLFSPLLYTVYERRNPPPLHSPTLSPGHGIQM